MSPLRQPLSGAAVATIAFIVLLGAHPLATETIVSGYALVLAAIALTALTNVLNTARRRGAGRFDHELGHTHVPPSRPSELVRMERELTLAGSSALHFHTRLRPMLWEIAGARLDRTPTAADLGEETWQLLKPGQSRPADNAASGLSLRRIRTLLDTLERL